MKLEIKEEEYDIVGYIKKVCVCEHCNQIMNKGNLQVCETNDEHLYKYEMICPKCGKKELVDSDTLSDQFKLLKKPLNNEKKETGKKWKLMKKWF